MNSFKENCGDHIVNCSSGEKSFLCDFKQKEAKFFEEFSKKEKMPRAFLITHRRYNGTEELEESGQGSFFIFLIL